MCKVCVSDAFSESVTYSVSTYCIDLYRFLYYCSEFECQTHLLKEVKYVGLALKSKNLRKILIYIKSNNTRLFSVISHLKITNAIFHVANNTFKNLLD